MFRGETAQISQTSIAN